MTSGTSAHAYPPSTTTAVRVDDSQCTGRTERTMFGGWLMGALADAAQLSSGRRLQSLTTTFLSPASKDDELSIVAKTVRAGRRTSAMSLQAYLPSGLAAMGVATLIEPTDASPTGSAMPVAPPPEAVAARTFNGAPDGGLGQSLEIRPIPAEGENQSTLMLWARLREPAAPETAVAVLSDQVAYAAIRALPGVTATITMSAHLDLVAAPTSEWMLFQIELTGWTSDLCVGAIEVWDQSGRFVATAGQTVRTVRRSA